MTSSHAAPRRQGLVSRVGGITSLVLMGCLMFASDEAAASGWLVGPGGEKMEILSHHVEATIVDSVVETRVEQIFRNPTSRTVEATYMFPLPKGAAVVEFAMWTRGVRREAVLTDAEHARSVYDTVTRQRRDPAILEMLDDERFRIRVFPVLPKSEQRIELVYHEVVTTDLGVSRWKYPLGDGPEDRVKRDLTFSVRLRSSSPVTEVYSPTHDVDIVRDDDGILVGYEKRAARLDDDFAVFYRTEQDDLSFRVTTHRRGDDGTFLLTLRPGAIDEGEVLAKDIVMVMDVSGSMRGSKLERAKEAMRFFVHSLGPRDRFDILVFSTGVRSFRSGLVDASPEQRAEALAFIDSLDAAGGTAIDAALDAALARGVAERAGDEARPVRVLFVTDGQPTVGERDPAEITRRVVSANRARARVFSFGIETNEGAALLNRIAARTGGTADLVEADEDLEIEISDFVARYSRPVFSDIRVRVDGVEAHELYPIHVPDLFAGGEVRVVGKYGAPGTGVVHVEGIHRGRTIELVGEAKFTRASQGKSPVERLWAQRKIGFLFDEVQCRGMSQELRDEIVTLSRSAHVLSPYTAMILLESESDYRRFGLEPPREALDVLADIHSESGPLERVGSGGADRRTVEGGTSANDGGRTSTTSPGGAYRGPEVSAARGRKMPKPSPAIIQTGVPPVGRADVSRSRPYAPGSGGAGGGVAGGGPLIGPRSGPGGSAGVRARAGATTPGSRRAPETTPGARDSSRDRPAIEGDADWLLGSTKRPTVSAMSLARLEAVADSLHGTPDEPVDARSASVALYAFAQSGTSRRDVRYGESIKRAMEVVALDSGVANPEGGAYLEAMWITASVLAMLQLDDAPMYRVVASRRVAWVLDQLEAGCAASPAEVRYRAIALALDVADAALRVGLATPTRVERARDTVGNLGTSAIETRLEALAQGDDRAMIRSELAAAAEVAARFESAAATPGDADVLRRRVCTALALAEPDANALRDEDRSAAIYWATRYLARHLTPEDWRAWTESVDRALVAIRVVAPTCTEAERRAAAYGVASAVIAELPNARNRR